jgi:type IV fimbrial biogenesis protein FimT
MRLLEDLSMSYPGSPTPPRRNQDGFSTVELMVVLTISAVLMSTAAPAMGDFVRNTRLRTASFDLMRTINYARIEAIKRKIQVVLCRSADSTAATPTCGGTAREWTTGFLVFADANGNAVFDPASDSLLRVGMPLTAGLSLRTNSTSNRNLQYKFDGSTDESGTTARFALCDPRGSDFARQLNVSPVGRPKLTRLSSNGDPINCDTPE